MKDERKIKVVKGGIDRGTLRAEREQQRQRELKKIKDELLTLARRVEAVANADAK